ncbi:hypothetical protein RvY_07687-1 [Ramazzottius varieornatus]|uniref:Thyrotropin-releasing hormone receptor n=1 Tax=Ramazzottius varieornatus TaxID=947166 RepID=A0A1D1V5R8_RAMVA|nr:hypothetical protein RvY_07687-1 [Ramazzottius varieornatus]
MEDTRTSGNAAAFEFPKTMAQMARHDTASVAHSQREDIGSFHFRIWATLLHSLIFILGVVGNVLLILTVRRTRGLRTSTYCYLVSLAWADIIVLLSAVPEAIVSHHTGIRWHSGQVGCSVMIFTNFLGINAGSLSIFAFTLDRFIASVKPIYILRVCNWKYAKKVTLGLWLFAVCYCLPWLGLTEVREFPSTKEPYCDFRFSRQAYMYWFAADLMLFYVCPLVFAGYVFCMLAGKLRKSIRGFKQAANDAEENQISAADSAECNLRGRDDRTTFALPLSDLRTVRSQERQSGEPQLLQAAMLRKMIRSRTRVREAYGRPTNNADQIVFRSGALIQCYGLTASTTWKNDLIDFVCFIPVA